jgi:hypothetical protein
MTEEEQKHHNNADDHDDSLSLSLGIVNMRLTGKMLAIFLPYGGAALIIMAIAYAITVVIESLRHQQ